VSLARFLLAFADLNYAQYTIRSVEEFCNTSRFQQQPLRNKPNGDWGEGNLLFQKSWKERANESRHSISDVYVKQTGSF